MFSGFEASRTASSFFRTSLMHLLLLSVQYLCFIEFKTILISSQPALKQIRRVSHPFL